MNCRRRTVDSLGLRPEELELERKPTTPVERLVVVDDHNRRNEGKDNKVVHVELVPESSESGYVLEGCYRYYRIFVPKRTSLSVQLLTHSGDPDMYVCNRFQFPTHEQHTWKSAGVGDDIVEVKVRAEEVGRGGRDEGVEWGEEHDWWCGSKRC